MAYESFDFTNARGHKLAGRLEMPEGSPRAFAIFAHCFTCSKDVLAARWVTRKLSERGIAALRFDFTGLGASEGDFSDTTFSTNIEDLLAAAASLTAAYQAPAILIGHSLGGAAALAAASHLPHVRAVVTIGAPAEPVHVLHQFEHCLEDIEANGEAEVALPGKKVVIRKAFLDDVRGRSLEKTVRKLKRAVLILHAPTDKTVGIDNAAALFAAAKHPKSFITLDDADHLLTRPEDAAYAARVIAAWVSRYVPAVAESA